MKKPLLSIMIPLLCAALCLAPRAAATTLARMSLTELAHAAGVIVRVRCVSSASQWDKGAIWTFSEFEVSERLKGSPESRIRVRVPGGRVGHLVTVIEAAPRFQPGEESILFLEATLGGDYAVTAWAEGTFRIHVHPQTGRELVTQESRGYAVFDAATKSFRAEGIRDVSVGEFRERVAAALAQPAAGARQ
jgi:hypothetical protein